MSREVRMVPPGYEHPKKADGRLLPLHDRFEERLKDGCRPIPEDYMLVGVPDSERTHYMMFETTSEGTPISPDFSEPENLARWLADTGASSFGTGTATYDQWLSAIKRGHTVSAVYDTKKGIRSGVEDMHDTETER